MKIKYYRQPEHIVWYLQPFTIIYHNTAELEIGFTVPFRVVANRIWWWFPYWLYDYQIQDCENFYPDYVNPDKGTPCSGNKVKSFFGYVIVFDENEKSSRQWWKHMKRLKDI